MQKLPVKQFGKARRHDGALDIDRLRTLVGTVFEEAEQDRERIDHLVALMGEELGAFQAGLESAIEQRTKELKASRKELRLQNERFNAAIENMAHGLSMYDSRQRLVICNQQFLEIYGLPKRFGRIGTSFRSILEQRVLAGTWSGSDAAAYIEGRLAIIERAQKEISVHRVANGTVIQVNHQPMPGGGWVSTHRDVTEMTRLQDEHQHLAYHDALTGLPNRHKLQRQIADQLQEADGLGCFALLFVDLDGFKSINDTLGHASGDMVLREVSQRLLHSVGEAGLVARMGGDEFAVVMKLGSSMRAAHVLAVQLVEAAQQPFLIDGQLCDVTFSVGIAVSPNDGASADSLLKNADLALYAAKNGRRGSYCFFEPAMGRAQRDRRRLESDLAGALGRGEFEMHYQPILNLKTQTFAGFEALIRWRNDGELVSPAKFIPLAEETGLIVPIGEWVLREAIAEAARWPKHLRVAINVSSVQFQRGNVVATIMNALGAAGMSPERVEIEITESVFLEKNVANLDALRQLHALGLKIALDDFGTGYSSLSYLLSFPFDKIKIDGSFVRALDNARGAHAIVRAVSEIGDRMGMRTTAEGIETAEQLRNVHAVGYTEAQGYLIARPMPAAQVRVLLGVENDEMPVAPLEQRAAG